MHFDFTRVADPNRVLDQVAEEEDRRDKLAGKRRDGEELHLPYWAELWDSSLAIIEFLAETLPAQFGCAWLQRPRPRLRHGPDRHDGRGARARVMFADLEPEALLFARLNAIEFEERVRTRRLNWQKARLTEQFDLIIGADILYDKTQWDFPRTLLARPPQARRQRPAGRARPTDRRHVPRLDQPASVDAHTIEKSIPTRSAPIRIFQLKSTA